tara:strand:+ start:564 stop:758 length:195 start_codon:yes stop_codon:yes gene_type:complete
MKKKDLKEMTLDELDAHLSEVHKEQFDLKFKKGSGQLENPSRIKELRRNVARIKTLQNEKKAEI